MPSIDAPSHFTQLRDWSKRKHEVLKEYLPAFCRALSRQVGAGTIWYVDGYAGAGMYRDPDNPHDPGVPGSPVLAAEITQELSYNIRCLNVEGDPANFESLQRETARFPHVENMHADFNDVVQKVLDRVKGMPAFFFLDPFGTKDLPMAGVIDQIAMRRSPTDILLRYATEAVRRLAGTYQKDAKGGDANAQNLDKWFRGQQWRTIIDQYEGSQRDNELIQYYMQQLGSISNGRLKIVCSYPIRSTSGITKYHLIFATGNRLGMKLMSDILFTADTKYKADKAAYKDQKVQEKHPGQTSMFEQFDQESVDDSKIKQIEDIKKSILEQAQKGHRRWVFEDLRCTLIENGWFAQFSEKEFRDACKSLYEDGKIKRISPNKAWNRKTEFEILV